VALGQVFSEYFGFPCQFAFNRLLHNHHHLSSGAGTIGQTVADVPSGHSLTPLRIYWWKTYNIDHVKGGALYGSYSLVEKLLITVREAYDYMGK
jgi:hypothetical protein